MTQRHFYKSTKVASHHDWCIHHCTMLFSLRGATLHALRSKISSDSTSRAHAMAYHWQFTAYSYRSALGDVPQMVPDLQWVIDDVSLFDPHILEQILI